MIPAAKTRATIFVLGDFYRRCIESECVRPRLVKKTGDELGTCVAMIVANKKPGADPRSANRRDTKKGRNGWLRGFAVCCSEQEGPGVNYSYCSRTSTQGVCHQPFHKQNDTSPDEIKLFLMGGRSFYS